MESIVNSEKLHGLKVFSKIEEMAEAFFLLFEQELSCAQSENRTCNIALSGGNTPLLIFEFLARKQRTWINLHFLHIYWSDERCVAPDSKDSNYGNIWKSIIRYIDIPEENIHRIRGEDDPLLESKRYSDTLRNHIPIENGFPRFDLMLLGIGEDGHTASIFPNAMEMLNSDNSCYVAIHPQTKQNRITLSLRLINNSKKILFMVTGKSKSDVIHAIAKNKKEVVNYPAAYVKPKNGELFWYLDSEASRKLRKRFIFF